MNYNDPKGAGDYFTNATRLSKFADSQNGAYGGGNTGLPPVHVDPIPYFEDVFPQMAGADPNYPNQSATEALYNLEWAPNRYVYGETQALADVDFYCNYGCPNGTIFWDQQFSSLIALASIGMSYYNAGQLTLRHPSKNGLTMDFSYTYSRSIDMGSDAERSRTSYGGIQNSWNPGLSRGLSDFDTKHLISADWSYSLPFGRGKMLLPNSGRAGEAIWGGWQFSGLGRWSSGLPFSVIEPGWTTDWETQAWGITTGPVKVHKHYTGGAPEVFANVFSGSDPISAGATCGGCGGGNIRLPYPGEAGMRNNFRGDGIFDIDSSLSKSWNLTERAKVKFAWEVYNVTNAIRFDDNTNSGTFGTALTYPGFGYYSTRLGDRNFRRMQFGARIDF